MSLKSSRHYFSGGRIKQVGVVVAVSLAAQVFAEPAAELTITVRDNDTNTDQVVALESDYVPNVVFRENGLASFEALKAQAVAARTYAYFQIRNKGFVFNGQNDQVYSAGGFNTGLWLAAAQATEGEILTHPTINGEALAAFYVAGGIPTGNNGIVGDGPDPTNTERFVTYNQGATGTGVTKTTLGSTSNPFNRGAMSQNGGDFQSDNSAFYVDILKSYYGADIQVSTVEAAGTGAVFSERNLTDFDDYTDSQANSFAGNEGYFATNPNFSGSNRNVNAAGTSAARSDAFSQAGSHSQRIVVDHDDTSSDPFMLRLLAGADSTGTLVTSSAATNVELDAVGTLGFWLRTETAGMSVQLAVDDPGTAERGLARPVIDDGQWHRYEWYLEDDRDWEGWVNGNGEIAARVTLDSIQIFGSTDAEVYLDSVYYDPSAVLPTLGDLNRDGTASVDDIDGFILALLDETGYYFEAELNPLLVGDVNFDGLFNEDDIDPFAALLGDPSLANVIRDRLNGIPIPEPTSAALLLTLSVACAARHRRQSL